MYSFAQQTGSCDAGTQYCEANSLNTVNTTTTSSTNSNTNNNTNTSTSTSTSTNTNTNNNTNVNTSTNTNTNVNTNTSTVTQDSTVNQTVNNTSTSTNTNINQNTSTSDNTNRNYNESSSESNVTTDNTNNNTNNNFSVSSSDNTNRNINESKSEQTINQNVKTEAPPASAIAPSIMSYSQDLCTTGVSGAFQGQVFGFSGGKTIVDQNCERLKLSKYLYDMGMKVASVALLCQDERVFHAMIQSGTPCPYNGKIGDAALKEWKKYDKLRPDYEQYTADLKYIERKNKKLEKEYEKKMLENAEELSKQQVELDAVAAEKQKLIDEMNELKGVKTEKTNSPK